MASSAGWTHTSSWAFDDMGDVSKAGVPSGGVDKALRSPPGTGKFRTTLGPGGPAGRRHVPQGQEHAVERLAGWTNTGCGRVDYDCHHPPEVFGNGHRVKPREHDDYRRTLHPWATATKLSGRGQSLKRSQRAEGPREGDRDWQLPPGTPQTPRSARGVPTITATGPATLRSLRGDGGWTSSPFASPDQQRAAGQATKRLDRLNVTMPASLASGEDTGRNWVDAWTSRRERVADFKREGDFTNDAYFATARQSHELGGPTGLRDMSQGSPNRVARVK